MLCFNIIFIIRKYVINILINGLFPFEN